MPSFDLHYLPGSVAVNGTSMLDDNIAFALMADRAARWAASVPLEIKLSYLLPYASYHESRQNWRPLFFAKFFGLVANASSVEEAIGRIVSPNVFTQWTDHYWSASPRQEGDGSSYEIRWASSTAPPVVSPLEFIAYGYGSCSAWATMLTYTARAVGLPARQAGTPCWNSVFGGTDYRGLAVHNPNVSLCWHGGDASRGHGGGYLNNHNWCEVYLPAVAAADDAARGGPPGSWTFVNVPPGSKEPDAGLCGQFEPTQGCGFNSKLPAGHECDGVGGGPGAAMRDHPIFSATWSHAGEHSRELEGGEVINVADLTLSSGEAVSPLVWSPNLASPLGQPLSDVGLRMVNRTAFYRCKPSATAHPQ